MSSGETLKERCNRPPVDASCFTEEVEALLLEVRGGASGAKPAYEDDLGHDETSLVYLEAYGMLLWRNGLTDASRMVFKGLCELAQAWKSPELARYSRPLHAINDGVTYDAYAADAGDE